MPEGDTAGRRPVAGVSDDQDTLLPVPVLPDLAASGDATQEAVGGSGVLRKRVRRAPDRFSPSPEVQIIFSLKDFIPWTWTFLNVLVVCDTQLLLLFVLVFFSLCTCNL